MASKNTKLKFSEDFNGNFTFLGVWKIEFQYKYAGNQHSQMNLSKYTQKRNLYLNLSQKEKVRRNQVAFYFYHSNHSREIWYGLKKSTFSNGFNNLSEMFISKNQGPVTK
jgi:hypothetical protein